MAMANCMCRYLPISSLFPPSLLSLAATRVVASRKCTSWAGVKIAAQASQNEGAGEDSRRCQSGAGGCVVGSGSSRRQFMGLGAILATGLALAVAAPESNAAERECAEFTVAPSGLAFCDTAFGSGIAASKGMLIKAHYTGRLENGKVFDSSYKRGKPLTFRVGVGEVIRGWDQGIQGADGITPMLAGGKRTLRIPPELGYGERGAGCREGSCVIPPNSVLLFEVEFLGKA